MDTNALKKFAQAARNLLIDQVTSKLDLVLAEGSPARREHPKAMKDLDSVIARDGKRHVIEQVAYTWFNRFTALRFMDVNGYTQVGVVSPAEGQNRVVSPNVETLAENIGVITQEVFNLGDGSIDWHDTLHGLARRNTLEEIEEAFGRKLGFAARSYILSIRDEIEE